MVERKNVKNRICNLKAIFVQYGFLLMLTYEAGVLRTDPGSLEGKFLWATTD